MPTHSKRNSNPKPRNNADHREIRSSFTRYRENFVLVTSYLIDSQGKNATQTTICVCNATELTGYTKNHAIKNRPIVRSVTAR